MSDLVRGWVPSDLGRSLGLCRVADAAGQGCRSCSLGRACWRFGFESVQSMGGASVARDKLKGIVVDVVARAVADRVAGRPVPYRSTHPTGLVGASALFNEWAVALGAVPLALACESLIARDRVAWASSVVAVDRLSAGLHDPANYTDTDDDGAPLPDDRADCWVYLADSMDVLRVPYWRDYRLGDSPNLGQAYVVASVAALDRVAVGLGWDLVQGVAYDSDIWARRSMPLAEVKANLGGDIA